LEALCLMAHVNSAYPDRAVSTGDRVILRNPIAVAWQRSISFDYVAQRNNSERSLQAWLRLQSGVKLAAIRELNVVWFPFHREAPRSVVDEVALLLAGAAIGVATSDVDAGSRGQFLVAAEIDPVRDVQVLNLEFRRECPDSGFEMCMDFTS
jgi:hypothetical protein